MRICSKTFEIYLPWCFFFSHFRWFFVSYKSIKLFSQIILLWNVLLVCLKIEDRLLEKGQICLRKNYIEKTIWKLKQDDALLNNNSLHVQGDICSHFVLSLWQMCFASGINMIKFVFYYLLFPTRCFREKDFSLFFVGIIVFVFISV